MFPAVKCPPPPFSLEGEFNNDLVHDPPRHLDVAQFSCPEGYVFEVYDPIPDENETYSLVEDLSSTINLTCSEYGDWLPLEVPLCIRNLLQIHTFSSIT